MGEELAVQYAVPIVLLLVQALKWVFMKGLVKLRVSPSKAKDWTGIGLVLIVSYLIQLAGETPPDLLDTLKLSGMSGLIFKIISIIWKLRKK